MDYKVFSGLCPDDSCQAKLYFPAHKTVIECPNCGQCHSQGNLGGITEVTDYKEAITQMVKSLVWDTWTPKKESDSVKVHGLSNYLCKLLSPLFTKYGMDKEGKPRLLVELGHGETVDCGRLLSHRAFLIAPEHIEITGYGRDQSGSVKYLDGLLDIVRSFHGGEEVLIPIHADGDGHCLVHALSRAVTGREIFWHALRENLVSHLEANLETYKTLFRDFIGQDDWKMIIDEADPYHTSPEGFNLGLGNIHIFALANVLKRPIVLMDSLEGMKNVADYTGIFVPAMVEPNHCRGNLPLCVAWSGLGHNHFIPLVGVAGKPLPSIPQPLIPNVWGVDRTQGLRYLNFNDDGSLTVAGGKPLQKGYLLRLVSAMEKVFLERHSVAAKLVADMHLYVYKRVGFVGLHPDVATERTRQALRHDLIFRCLECNALSLANTDPDDLRPGGYLFELMTSNHGRPHSNVLYSFPNEGLECKYDAEKQCLVPFQFACRWCGIKRLRRVDQFGDPLLENGDLTKTPTVFPGQCCRFKHYWNGAEYENMPKQFELSLTLQGQTIKEKVTWFFGDSDPLLNSDSNDISRSIAEKYFGAKDTNFEYLRSKILVALRTFLSEHGISDEPFTGLYGDNEPQGDAGSGVDFEKDLLKSQMKTAASSAKIGDAHPQDIPSTSKSFSKDKKQLLSQTPSTEITSKMDSEHSSAISSAASSKTLKIRISTSDGRQKTINIDRDLSYVGLLDIVKKHFSVPPTTKQVLKLGFPPKLLEATDEETSLGLQNGDRVTVEIRPDPKPASEYKRSTRGGSWSQKGLRMASVEDEMLHDFVGGLQRIAEYGGPERRIARSSESVEAALSAVVEMAKMIGKSVWDYAVTHPELFRPGGAFYDQFSRDVGLENGRHCMLPLLPGLVFCYNAEKDRVDLCLEPTGHFAINPEVVRILEKIPTTQLPVKETVEQSATQDVMTIPQTADEKMQVNEVQDNATPTDSGENKRNAESFLKAASELEETAKTSADSSKNETTAVEKEFEGPAEKESKLAPGFRTLPGREPTVISDEEIDQKRRQFLDVLKSRKRSDS